MSPRPASAPIPRVRLPGLALALLASACASLDGSGPGRGAAASDPFPPWATVGPVRAEARYYLDQAEILGGDLLAEHGLVPVALRLGVVGSTGRREIAADPEQMGLVLHLADGTALACAGAAELDVRRRRLERLLREGFQAGMLAPWERSREGFVYFRVPPSMYVDPRLLTLTHPAPGGTRTVALGNALVSFELVVDGELRAVHVGLELDRSGGRLRGEPDS